MIGEQCVKVWGVLLVSWDEISIVPQNRFSGGLPRVGCLRERGVKLKLKSHGIARIDLNPVAI